MDVVANYVVGEDAVGALFSDGMDKGKAQADDFDSPSKCLRKNNKKKKKVWQGKCEATDDDFIATVERKKPRGPPEGAIFDKILKEP